MASGKNRHEHQLVIDTMRDALQPLCTDLRIAATPQLSHTAALWHLSTPITGRLRDTATTALDLALALHPTPAVGGVPTDAAVQLIGALEAIAGSTPVRSGGVTGTGTAAGWWRSAARSCPPIGAPRWRIPAAALSPDPIPTTKSTRPQRNSRRF
ncbi:Putative isochorismate synthase MenF [Mycobacterium talmoniae]|uniref:Isochorismate synthase MenF n=1 Tax=Mycobacterium talmoniae TaxID=1858794 RepID=A0A2S8BJC2_9MYCO|nr:Putative isochorismate synthase MenF [Mycobacterium talmoniae]